MKILNHRLRGLEAGGRIAWCFSGSDQQTRRDLDSRLRLGNVGKVSNIFVPAFPGYKREGMLFPWCRGPLKINSY